MWPGKLNYSQPRRVWLVTSRLGTGKSLTFFYSATYVSDYNKNNFRLHDGPYSSFFCKSSSFSVVLTTQMTSRPPPPPSHPLILPILPPLPPRKVSFPSTLVLMSENGSSSVRIQKLLGISRIRI
jgi:hypothetical protein